MYPEKQSFFVLGLSRSGIAAAEYLLKRRAEVFLYDDVENDRVEQALEELKKQGAKGVKKEELSSMYERCDALVLSPGIPIDHPLAVAFKRAGRAVIGETELAARALRAAVVAVTGTNGKTTAVSMIEKILKDGGRGALALGNVGRPLLHGVELAETDVAVAEISSFQLETLISLRPHIAVVLNVSEDHLNRHYNMENYIFLKARLLKNSTETEYAVLNYDDEIVRGFAEKTKARIVWFSLRERVHGAYLEENGLYFLGEKILSVDDLPIGGMHNVANALAAICAAKLMGIPSSVIGGALASFKGIRHRLEEVGKVDGVTYINDSKGTNVDATIKAIGCMKEETVLLVGGKDKGYDYNVLFTALRSSKIAHAILYGENRFKLLESALRSGYKSFSLCNDFSTAVRLARMTASGRGCVLLSPASASFDEFSSFEERGEKFVGFVQEWQEECKRKEIERKEAERRADKESADKEQAETDGKREEDCNPRDVAEKLRKDDEDEE